MVIKEGKACLDATLLLGDLLRTLRHLFMAGASQKKLLKNHHFPLPHPFFFSELFLRIMIMYMTSVCHIRHCYIRRVFTFSEL